MEENPKSQTTTWDGLLPGVNNGISTTNLNWCVYRISSPSTLYPYVCFEHLLPWKFTGSPPENRRFPQNPPKKTYFPNLPPFFHGAQTRFFKTLGGKGIPDDFPKIVRLDYVHLFSSFFSSGYQVVHRDLKTENLLGRAVGSWICPVGNDGKKSEAFGSLVFRMVI